jgi:hypothetical protein
MSGKLQNRASRAEGGRKLRGRYSKVKAILGVLKDDGQARTLHCMFKILLERCSVTGRCISSKCSI